MAGEVYNSGEFDDFVQEIWLADKDSHQHEEFSHLLLDSSHQETYLYNLQYYTYLLGNLMIPILQLAFDLSSLILNVILTRSLHLLKDLIVPGNKTSEYIITSFLGFYQLTSFMDTQETGVHRSDRYLLLGVLSSYVIYYCASLKFLDKNTIIYRIVSVIFIYLPILLNEYFIHIRLFQHHAYLRGILMVLSMKETTLLFDRNSSSGILSALSYLIHPATCIFGPWHPYDDHETKDLERSVYISKYCAQISRAVLTFMKTLVILLVSQIISNIFLHFHERGDGNSIFIRAALIYLRAQEFRFSHFFICYLTMSLCTLWQHPSDNDLNFCSVVKIEWPRSLVQVVIHWHRPIHVWLKSYIFRPVKAYTSSILTTIFATYLISSTLHGFKFHIWAVLLTLGSLTWIEHNLRLSLSQHLDACILSKSCSYSKKGCCTLKHGKTIYNSALVRAINTLFSILTMAHLAFLGYIFTGNTDETSFTEVLKSWSELYYYSYVIAIVQYVVYCISATKVGDLNREASRPNNRLRKA